MDLKNVITSPWLQQDTSKTVILFRRCMYGVLLLDLLLNIPILSHTWAPNTLTPILGNHVLGVFAPILNLLSLPPFSTFYIVFALIYATLLLLGLCRIFENSTAILIFVSFKIIGFKTIDLTHGGHHLAGLLLFYNIFLNNSTQIWLRSISNIALLFARLQLCSMYLFAGINKLYGLYWIDGTALNLVLLNDVYSNWYFRDFLLTIPWLTIMGTYLVLAYQLLFSVLVWIHSLKKYVLTMGILFHLSIWWLTGLYDFAWFAIASYTLFWGSTLRVKGRKINNL